ncbi:MAG TPA: hypothetical protein VFZ69_03925 [Longimicrobiales bacterium]
MPRLRPLLLLLAVLSLSGCRTMSVGSPAPSETYSISVHNETGVAMIVSYNDGRGDALLGNVRPGATERFVIAAPASHTITVQATAASGGRTAGPYSVTLVAGSTQTVRLR